VGYHTRNGGKLPYDPWTTHPISVADLLEVAKYQNVQFRRGDILLIRVGFIQKYYAVTTSERHALQGRPETLSVFFSVVPNFANDKNR
jgi:predicted aminopeptidase